MPCSRLACVDEDMPLGTDVYASAQATVFDGDQCSYPQKGTHTMPYFRPISIVDLRSVGRGFKSCSRQRCVTTLGKLFTPMCLVTKHAVLGTGQRAVMLCGWGGNRRHGGK